MQDTRHLTLAEAERQLKANLAIIEVLKGNTPLEGLPTTGTSGSRRRRP